MLKIYLENVRPGMSEAATNLKYLGLLVQNLIVSYCCFIICLHPGKTKPNNQYKITSNNQSLVTKYV